MGCSESNPCNVSTDTPHRRSRLIASGHGGPLSPVCGRTHRPANLPGTRSDTMRDNITFTNSKGRGRNGWFRVATASLLGGHDQIYLELSSKRVAATPPICLEL